MWEDGRRGRRHCSFLAGGLFYPHNQGLVSHLSSHDSNRDLPLWNQQLIFKWRPSDRCQFGWLYWLIVLAGLVSLPWVSEKDRSFIRHLIWLIERSVQSLGSVIHYWVLMLPFCGDFKMMDIGPSAPKKPMDGFKFSDQVEQMFLQRRRGWHPDGKLNMMANE